jgi:hypothetical protein
MRTDIDLVEHAAALLDGEALCTRQSHNVDWQSPTWEGEPEAKAQHDDFKNTSTELYALAERMRNEQAKREIGE